MTINQRRGPLIIKPPLFCNHRLNLAHLLFWHMPARITCYSYRIESGLIYSKPNIFLDFRVALTNMNNYVSTYLITNIRSNNIR